LFEKKYFGGLVIGGLNYIFAIKKFWLGDSL
jgi:hypothetical protein